MHTLALCQSSSWSVDRLMKLVRNWIQHFFFLSSFKFFVLCPTDLELISVFNISQTDKDIVLFPWSTCHSQQRLCQDFSKLFHCHIRFISITCAKWWIYPVNRCPFNTGLVTLWQGQSHSKWNMKSKYSQNPCSSYNYKTSLQNSINLTQEKRAAKAQSYSSHDFDFDFDDTRFRSFQS